MSKPTYMSSRAVYLQVERTFRRKINIIQKYTCPQQNETKEIWLASLEFNIDEVPFVLNLNNGQVVAWGEDVRVHDQKSAKYASKYRQGTLVIVMNNVSILFILIIFPNGGPGVLRKLQQKAMVYCNKVYVLCSLSGSMTHSVWLQTLNLFQNLTKSIRGCHSVEGTDWTIAIVLSMDNYGVHLDEKLAKDYSKLFGIYMRCLLKNASHFQQPVDQHVGIWIKNLIINNLSTWTNNLNAFYSFGRGVSELKLGKWREFVIRFVAEAIQKIETVANRIVLIFAWVNLGVYLPLDGSLDGDDTTLHRNSVYRTPHDKQLRAQELLSRVTLPDGARVQSRLQTRVRYSLRNANENSRPTIYIGNQYLQLLKMDLYYLNKDMLQNFDTIMSTDFTDLRQKLPCSYNIITTSDVLTLRDMYSKYRPLEVNTLFTSKLGIPYRHVNGTVIARPTRGIYIYIY